MKKNKGTVSMHKANYRRLLMMIVLSFISMYLLMYTMVRQPVCRHLGDH